MKMIVRAVLFAAVFAMTACATKVTRYEPSPDLTSANAATMIGKHSLSPAIAGGDVSPYVARIDGIEPRGNPYYDADKPVLIAPGPHTIVVGLWFKGGFGVRYYNSEPIQTTLEAGKTYTLEARVHPAGSANVSIIEGGREIARADARLHRATPEPALKK